MSKANKDGWIRHRGGKFPESAKGFAEIEVRFRNGDVDSSDSWPRWTHNCGGLDIMAWRGHDLSTTEDICAVVDAAYKPAIAHADLRERYDGPIKWRDRITEIDSTTKALTTERAELVQKLAGEGFALIGRINDLLTEAAQKHEAQQPDPGKWEVGDSVECISSNYSFITVGTVYVITGFDRNMVQFLDDDGTEMEYERAHFKFHSHPSA